VRDAREELPSTMEVSEQLNPWVGLAKAYPEPNQTIISIQKQDGDEAVMILTTPLAIPCIRPFTLYWDSKTTFEVRPGASQQVAAICSESLRFMQDIMHTLLRSTHSDQRSDNRKDFVTLFTPNIHEQRFETWLSVNRGRLSDGIDAVHPKASLERWTGRDKIEYTVGFEESDNHVYRCSIKINNIEAVTVGGCLTKNEAVMRAADGAAKLISRTKSRATGTPSQHM
jgi:hypothetical protein